MRFIVYTCSRWIKNVASLKFFSILLEPLGILWICIEVSAFFSDTAAKSIKGAWWLFVMIGFAWAIWRCKPKSSISCRLKNRDSYIEIAVGNFFNFKGALVIGANTTFDTLLESKPISEASIQGQFTQRYYPDIRMLDLDLEKELNSFQFEELSDSRKTKTKRYDIGTVVKVEPNGRTAYFLAIAHINQHYTAYGEYEYVKDSLAKLWVFIGERGNKDQIIIPLLGTRFMRLKVQREDVVKEIIKSFIAACAEKVFCERLAIVISPDDIVEYSIDLEKLGNFLTYTCEFTEYSPV